MIITIESLPEGMEEEIIIRSNNLDSELIDLLYAIKAGRSKITAFNNNEILKLSPDEIYYFEAVDNRVCACCRNQVYDVKQKLYELEKMYEKTDFQRISKSMIVNVSKIAKIVPMFNGRLEAILKNGEKIVISRQYVTALKQKFGI